MLFEIALVLPIYVIFFLGYLRFKPIIKMMTEFGDNFLDEVATPKKGVENREKREFLKDLIT